MLIPGYMCIKDHQGNGMSGSAQVTGRLGFMEIGEYPDKISIPT
jgi:hypothetical protein